VVLLTPNAVGFVLVEARQLWREVLSHWPSLLFGAYIVEREVVTQGRVPITATEKLGSYGRRARESRLLTSLLPGLREVRTPLTVGYLYLLLGWLWFADHIPRHKPKGDGLVARLFELSDIFGPAASVAALTFVAYILGALLTLSFPNVLARSHLFLIGVDARQTRRQLLEVLDAVGMSLFEYSQGFSPDERDELERDIERAQRAGPADLRVRLLVANQELYGEYDRLAAEAEFRLNLCLPLIALSITAAADVHWAYALVGLGLTSALAGRGLVRQSEARSVLDRAMLSGLVDHPLQTILKRFGKSTADPDR
jgi:hypothetical protein